jgi:UDP-N-acetylglucosamine 2-epimerase (non-hydrolysing)
MQAIHNGEGKQGRTPEFWDGHAAERIVADLSQWLYQVSAKQPLATV